MKEIRAIGAARQHAEKMFQAKKLSSREMADIDAVCFQQLIDALPVNEFNEMMKDGRLEQLQALAGHDGERHPGEVDAAREAVVAKLKHDYLDNAWLDGEMNSRDYADANRNIEKFKDEEAGNRIAAGDYDGVASEYFASRHDTTKADQASDLSSYLQAKFGGHEKNSRELRNQGSEAPPGYVKQELIVQQHVNVSNSGRSSRNEEKSDLGDYIERTYGRDDGGSGYTDHDANDEEE